MPIYHEITTFLKPTVPVEVGGNGPKMTMVSVDHLSSLKTLNKRDEEGVWVRAEKPFAEKVAELPNGNLIYRS